MANNDVKLTVTHKKNSEMVLIYIFLFIWLYIHNKIVISGQAVI